MVGIKLPRRQDARQVVQLVAYRRADDDGAGQDGSLAASKICPKTSVVDHRATLAGSADILTLGCQVCPCMPLSYSLLAEGQIADV